MKNKTPKVFISYSWSSSEKVLEIAERLLSNGVDVVLDKWELKEGQDKYAFMEKSVTDSAIDKILLMCDKPYSEKADSRTGGVGDETMIITPAVYGKADQEKFIPIILEVDENSQPYLPAYVKSRIYFDLSAEVEFESTFEKLLRNIHGKPLHVKPALGMRPEWLENDSVDLSHIRDLVKQTRGYLGGNTNKADFLLRKTVSSLLTALSEFQIAKMDSNILLKTIESMKSVRDLFVDFLEALIYSGLPVTETVTSFFEQVYNSTHDASGRPGCVHSDFAQYDFFLWETLISTTAILFDFEKYAELNSILRHTYFFRKSFYPGYQIEESNYTAFKGSVDSMKSIIEVNGSNSQTLSLAGDLLVQREKQPLLTKQSLSRADIMLCQLGISF